jgi:hypothetical protein
MSISIFSFWHSGQPPLSEMDEAIPREDMEVRCNMYNSYQAFISYLDYSPIR